MRSRPESPATTFKGPTILVIGATGLDVIVSHSSGAADTRDTIGTVRFAMGGTAFNVASNIAARGLDVLLLTSVSSDTVSSALIKQHLERMPFRHIVQHTSGPRTENVHVAQLNRRHVVSAVTSSGVERAYFPRELLERQIRAAALVICDCNLRVSHIREISRLCRRYKRTALAAAVSAAKVPRLQAALGGLTQPVFEAVVMNSVEAAAVVSSPLHVTRLLGRLLCKRVGARYVVITRGVTGFTVVSFQGEIRRFRAPKMSRIVSELGAGDTVLAALGAFIVTHDDIDWSAWHSSYLPEWLSSSLAGVAATTGGVLAVRPIGTAEHMKGA